MDKGVHGIVLEDRSLLVVKKNKDYILPGGKYNFVGEKDSQVLEREFREELSDTHILVGTYYNSFSGITPNKRKPFVSRAYFCVPFDKINLPSSEIVDKKYVTSLNLNNTRFSDITKKVIWSLYLDDLID